MATLREKYNLLKEEIQDSFNELIKSTGQIVLIDNSEIGEDGYIESDNYFEERQDSGDTEDIFIIRVTNGLGLYVVKADNPYIENAYYIGFNDLADTLDKIYILELMQK